MSLRFALLGLLAVQPASGYDLKRAINRSTYFIWNATGPQVYNTLNKLRDDGFITSKSQPQQGKPDKHIHTITTSGRSALKGFMEEPIRAAVTRDEVLLRIFFGNFASKKTIKRELEAYLDRIGQERAQMQATETRINAHPGHKHEARRFQFCRCGSRSPRSAPWSRSSAAFSRTAAGLDVIDPTPDRPDHPT